MPQQQPAEILVPALAEYLVANTDIDDWMFYGDIVVPGAPKGAIAIVGLTNQTENLAINIKKRWRFSLRATIQQTTEDELTREATRWIEYLVDEPMRSLWRTGYTTTIATQTLTNAFKGILFNTASVQYELNQDGGGRAKVNWLYEWTEQSLSQAAFF